MNHQNQNQSREPDRLVLPAHVPLISNRAQRRIAIAVDLSDESAYAVRWTVENYLRPGDSVVLLHVRQTSVLYGADWGFVNNPQNQSDGVVQSDLTAANAKNIAEPLEEAGVPYKIHVVKDHDMKERLCLEVERLGLSAMIMGSRGIGIGAARRSSVGRLGSVSDYCVHHCVCPVVVIRYPEDNQSQDDTKDEAELLHPVPEEEDAEYHDCSD